MRKRFAAEPSPALARESEKAESNPRWRAPSKASSVPMCRNGQSPPRFDAVICLYDVVGSYADDGENLRILQTCCRHLKPGGKFLLSVMNFELTEGQGEHFFSLESDSRPLSELRPSTKMENTGNVFDPNFYLIDSVTQVVYRKEQFAEGDQLPTQLIVRDRRYRRNEIEDMCRKVGLEVIWSRFVQSGHWEFELAGHDSRAKEILVLCRKPLWVALGS